MVGIMIQKNRSGIFFWIFCDGNGDDLGGPCLDLVIGGIMNASDIDDMQLNYPSPVPVNNKFSHLWDLDLLWEFGSFEILWGLGSLGSF